MAEGGCPAFYVTILRWEWECGGGRASREEVWGSGEPGVALEGSSVNFIANPGREHFRGANPVDGTIEMSVSGSHAGPPALTFSREAGVCGLHRNCWKEKAPTAMTAGHSAC